MDASFDAGLAPLNIFSIAQQQDGKLLVAALNYGYGRGTFAQFDGAPRSELARLLPDGTLDSSFNFDGQVNGAIFSVAVLTDGQIMVGGAFTSFAGVACGGVVRINPNGFVSPLAPAINSQTMRRRGNESFEFQLAAPTNQTVFIQATTNLSTGPWVNIQTQTVSSGSLTVTDTQAGQAVRRFYRAIIR